MKREKDRMKEASKESETVKRERVVSCSYLTDLDGWHITSMI